MKNDFWSVLFQRRSVRRYEDRPVPGDLLEKILQAAAVAPSAHNAQPWHFVVVSSKDLLGKLARAMARSYVQDMRKQNFSPESIKKKTVIKKRNFGLNAFCCSIRRRRRCEVLIRIDMRCTPGEGDGCRQYRR